MSLKRFGPGAQAELNAIAAENSSHLGRFGIAAQVDGYRLNNATQVVEVTASANIAPILPRLPGINTVVTQVGYAGFAWHSPFLLLVAAGAAGLPHREARWRRPGYMEAARRQKSTPQGAVVQPESYRSKDTRGMTTGRDA
jgi:hypothetical protein